jgi:hypothetical protein
MSDGKIGLQLRSLLKKSGAAFQHRDLQQAFHRREISHQPEQGLIRVPA